MFLCHVLGRPACVEVVHSIGSGKGRVPLIPEGGREECRIIQHQHLAAVRNHMHGHGVCILHCVKTFLLIDDPDPSPRVPAEE